MYSVLTAPFYLIPFVWVMRRNPVSAPSIYFTYALVGAWLFGAMLEVDVLPESALVANWAHQAGSVPWLGFAALNFIVFVVYAVSSGSKPSGYMLAAAIQVGGRSLSRFTITLLGLIALQYLLILKAFGGWSEWFAASYARVAISDSLVNYLFPLTLGINVACLVLLAAAAAGRRSAVNWVFLWIAVLLQAAFLIASGGRSVLLFFVFSVFVVFRRRLHFTLVKKACLVVLAIWLSASMIEARYKTQNAEAQFDMTLQTAVAAAYTGLPFIDHISLAMRYADIRGNDIGEVYVTAISGFIPRAIWPEKPMQLSRKMRQEFFGDAEGGIPPGLFGEAYIAFGAGGAIVAAILFGCLLSRVHRYCRRAPAVEIGDLRLAVFGTLIGFVLVRGGVDIGIYRVGIIVFAYFLLEKRVFRFASVQNAGALRKVGH